MIGNFPRDVDTRNIVPQILLKLNQTPVQWIDTAKAQSDESEIFDEKHAATAIAQPRTKPRARPLRRNMPLKVGERVKT